MTDIFSLDGLFTVSNFFTLLMLILLQAVLGFDNLLYITIESRRVEASRQRFVRRMGILVAIGFRIILLFGILLLFSALGEPLFNINLGNVIQAEVTFRAIVTLFGGAFIIWTAIKEIFHMLSVDHLEHSETADKRSVASAITLIVIMNLVFSFDSLLSAVALSDTFLLVATAIIIGGVMMVWLSDHVARFLEQNRAYEVLGLFILLVVGVLLVTDGGHLAHLELFGYEVQAMSKASFYFVIFVIVCVSVVQSKYRNKLMAQRDEAARMGIPTTEPDVGLMQKPKAKATTPGM
ncbi:TerC family protein [Parvularcula sp. LCG005]|uniref:TerC family protein n=1 Tax=Parvularcula sp. LCG005 TaxID=3078805 RepID=UPI0029424F61|nr:tellurium resistance protein TerC [Parvularcula sp. LCG005]WOI53086.1 tellurium resistance protein TerC [Parvularcula sp. LCG005]